MQKQRDISTDQCICFRSTDTTFVPPMYFLNLKFQVSSYLLWLYSLLWVGLFWTCANWLSCPLLKILMNNLLVGVICFISTFYINWRVNMVIVSRLEGMGIFSACRVYFKYFLTKTYLNMCSDMLFTQMHLAVTSWHFVLSPY